MSHSKHMCKECKKHRANFKDARGRRRADKDHDLCRRCMISQVDKNRAARMRVAYV